MRKPISAILAGLCAVALVGCGGSGSTVLGIDSNPRVRVVNDISDPSTVAVRVNGENVQNNATFGYTSDYSPYTNGNHSIEFTDANTQASLINATELFELNHYYTVVGYRNTGGTYSYLYLDDKPANATSNGQIRVVNASNTNYDVYVTRQGTDITGSAPTISNESTGDTTQGYTIADLGGNSSGTFEVRVTTPGTQTVIADTTFTVDAHESVTVVIASNGGATPTLQVLPGRTF